MTNAAAAPGRGPTTGATIQRGAVAAEAGYRRLVAGDGEPHRVRDDLRPGRRAGPRGARIVFRFVHVTDFQLADLTSPGRLEFCQERAGAPGWALMLPSYRPQELLAPHAIEALARTVRALTGEAGVDLVVTTGDNTDNAQRNELDAYLTLMDGGGAVDPGFGEPDALPSAVAGGAYWNPEPHSRDVWKTRLGYPDHPGLLAEAARPFTATGFGAPWLACFGNHDCLLQGRAPVTRPVQTLLTGAAKPIAVPSGARDPRTGHPLPAPPSPGVPGTPGTAWWDDAVTGRRVIDAYLADPMLLGRGPARPIEPSRRRRIVDRAEYIRAHLASRTGPPGHGFTAGNAASGTAYYVHDPAPGVRFVVLDTTNPGGYADGSVGARQLAWLDERLREAPDRMVVIVSHHGLSTLTNDAPPGPGGPGGPSGEADLPRHLAGDVAAVLHRHANVVLWVSGHTHVNRITPRPGPSGGFWEVATSSVAEWPVQAPPGRAGRRRRRHCDRPHHQPRLRRPARTGRGDRPLAAGRAPPRAGRQRTGRRRRPRGPRHARGPQHAPAPLTPESPAHRGRTEPGAATYHRGMGDEARVLRGAVDDHMALLVAHADGSPLIDAELAGRIGRVLLAVLDRWDVLAEPDRADVATAVRYYVETDDEIANLWEQTGLEDDAAVVREMLARVAPDLRL